MVFFDPNQKGNTFSSHEINVKQTSLCVYVSAPITFCVRLMYPMKTTGEKKIMHNHCSESVTYRK